MGVVLGASFLLTACSSEKKENTAKATDGESMNVMKNTQGEGNKPIPAVAKSYDVSKDKKTYTFHLRDSKWSNGTPVTAEDFVFSWKRAVNPDTAAEYAFYSLILRMQRKLIVKSYL